MTFFTNKKILPKIIIVVLLLLVFQFFTSTPVQAGDDTLLEPITGLFANLGDGIMEIMQKTFLHVETSGAWVETSSNLWLKILTIAAAVVIAVVAVIASIYSGGAAMAVFISIVGAVVKTAIGGLIVYYAVDTLHIGESRFLLT